MALSFASAFAESETPGIDLLAPADTSSPRATLGTLIRACETIYHLASKPTSNADFTAAADAERQLLECLDLSQQPEFVRRQAGREAAFAIKEVIDRIGIPPMEEVPGDGADQQASEAVTPEWRIPKTRLAIGRMDEGERKGEYLFTAQTVAHARAYLKRVQHLPYLDSATPGLLRRYLFEPRHPTLAAVVRRLPSWVQQPLLGNAVWQWIGLVVIVIPAAALLLFVGRAAYNGSHRLRASGRVSPLVWKAGLPLAGMWFILWVRDMVVVELAFRGPVSSAVTFLANVIVLLLAVMLILSISNWVSEFLARSSHASKAPVDDQVVRLVSRLVGIVIAILVFIEGGTYLGIPLSTLLAGAGVGGVAVALAAQDALKNVIAGMLITLDKPFRLGDRIIIKGRDGVVEGVGLRSVRLRTGSGHLITIPNSHVSSGDVENTSVRPHIQRVTDIALPLDLSRAKVEQAVRIVKGILQDHPGLDPKLPPRVFVPDLNRDSLTLRLICWYHPPDYWDYVAFCDETNLAIIEAFERAEIPFAPPTQRTFFDAFPGSPIGLKVDTKLSSNRGSEGSGALKEPHESDGRSA